MADDDKTIAVAAGSQVTRTHAATSMSDPLDAEWDNPTAIMAVMERYAVDYELAADMWHRFIDTVRKLRERAKATGKV